MQDLIYVQVSEGYEVIFRLSSVSVVKKLDEALFLSLVGEDKPLQIRGKAADAIWPLVRRSCLTIQTEPEGQECSA